MRQTVHLRERQRRYRACVTAPMPRRIAPADGFTLVELLIVVLLVGVLSAIASLSLMQARVSANESSAIAGLRSIVSAEIAYSAACASGAFATSLATLGVPPPAGTVAFLSPDLASAAVVQKSGYRFQLQPGLGSNAGNPDCNGTPTESRFYASGVPVSFGATGSRSFATATPPGTIWADNTVAAPPEPFGAPAAPIQ